MGLPEERGRSGSGSAEREEAGARNRVRSWSPPPEVSRSAHVPSLQRYRELHRRSVEQPRGEAGPGRPWAGSMRREVGVSRRVRNWARGVGNEGFVRRSGFLGGVGVSLGGLKGL